MLPIPITNRLSTWVSDKKKLSWITLSAFFWFLSSMTNEILVSDAPCAHAITLMPFRPSVLNSLPATPDACRMFSPTIATVARLYSARIAFISPVSISAENSLFSASIALCASALRTAKEVVFSLDACDTINTLTPFRASALNMRALIPMIPTMHNPETVIRQVSLIEDMPLMSLPSAEGRCSLMQVPGASGLKVFLISMGMFLWNTG